ncbi:hypothetical protein EV421DRAFT_1890378 [Armillaria borealis]|uniref:F-box domain-containing protein n=1 Tax=Armillaria borealis TaxID=47425 RepID=A0AA39JMR9_9AGAR|nr:hypothetical protein EV421DRAFT_1890378 [Armillaria borealis]
MLPLPFPNPPTMSSLSDARSSLETSIRSQEALATEISDAEANLAKVIQEAQCRIDALRREKTQLDEQILATQAYISPMRRLPIELLRDVFYGCFEDHPCCAWVLASVCVDWRRLALAMPRIWAKIRLVTTPTSSPETIRLWLERSGSSVPLDIEIYLHVAKGTNDVPTSSRRRRRSSSPPSSFLYPVSFPTSGPSYMISPTGVLPPANTPIIIPMSPSSHHSHDVWVPSSPPSYPSDRPRGDKSAWGRGTPWGFVAVYYLVEQMHRWERFVFRFDRQFPSMLALKSITGDAPLLKHFEVSAAESVYYPDHWAWLPNTPSTKQVVPVLDTVTLQFIPFKWSSPLFQSNLRNLNLRALPASQHPLNQILHILHANQHSLERVSLHFQTVLPPILPLSQLTLPRLKEFNLGGHYMLTNLVESLVLPELEELNLDIEARESIEEYIQTLLAKTPSTATNLKHLGIAYGYGTGHHAEASIPDTVSASSPPFYYGSGGVVVSWLFLNDLPQLESLRVGGSHLDVLMAGLGMPDEEMMTGAVAIGVMGSTVVANAWLCPKLKELGLRSCHGHEGWAKLVQAVEGRNPDGGATGTVINGLSPVRLKRLELYDSQGIGGDVIQWLEKRVDEVVWTESERSSPSMSPFA